MHNNVLYFHGTVSNVFLYRNEYANLSQSSISSCMCNRVYRKVHEEAPLSYNLSDTTSKPHCILNIVKIYFPG